MYFDEKAKEWDNNPVNIERAYISANEIREIIKPNPEMLGFEFGSGTGNLSYFLKDDFKTITQMDSSIGMLEVLQSKIKKDNISNFLPVLFDLEKYETDEFNSKFDVIFTSMTLHHIMDINALFGKFRKILRPQGYLAIVDLEKEDGSFHSHIKDFNGLNGFGKEELEKLLSDSGFEITGYKIIFEIEKQVKYPVFLMVAKSKLYKQKHTIPQIFPFAEVLINI
jgi:ubiquinone/menaquinone biosynthesis C-methylase UbiE